LKSEYKNTPTIETKRLILRKFTEKDVESIYKLYKDEEVNTFLPLFPLRSKNEASELLKEKYLKTYENPRGYHYAVCQKSEFEPIGYVIVNMDESHDLGYALRTEFWHRGIITEAVKGVIERIKADGLVYLTATHDVNNPRSGHVMRNVGMRYCYTYEELWKPKNISVHFRLYQLNLDGNKDRIYKGYWNKYNKHYVERNI